MKPFNLQDAINGKPVITRARYSLTFGAYIPQANGYNLFMIDPDGDVIRYNENGRYRGNDTESVMDLFMAPIKRTVWINLYGRQLESVCHPTEEDADKHASPNRIGGKAYPVEIEEGAQAAPAVPAISQTLSEEPTYREDFLQLAKKCGAVLTGKPDASEAITVVFSADAWRAFDLATAQPAAQVLNAWNPIETAPKDKSKVVLLRQPCGSVANGFFLAEAYAGNGAWIWPYIHKTPTHWMPLLAPPAAIAAQKGTNDDHN